MNKYVIIKYKMKTKMKNGKFDIVVHKNDNSTTII